MLNKHKTKQFNKDQDVSIFQIRLHMTCNRKLNIKYRNSNVKYIAKYQEEREINSYGRYGHIKQI